jgi:hypothetical protein
MWDYWVTDAFGRWNDKMMQDAGVPPLRDYVNRCYAAKGSGDGGSTGEPPLGDGMILMAPDIIVPKGSIVLLPVQLLNARDVLNMAIEMSYLPQIVSPVGELEKGSVITNIWEYKLKNPGLYRFAFAQLAPFNGSGTVVGLRFKTIGPGRSRTPLTLTAHNADDSKGPRLPLTVINGSITIYDPNDLLDPNNPNNPNPPGGPGGKLQPTCSGTGVQTVADAQCCLKMWVGIVEQSLHMDVVPDGVVDSKDAVKILQNVAKGLAQ